MVTTKVRSIKNYEFSWPKAWHVKNSANLTVPLRLRIFLNFIYERPIQEYLSSTTTASIMVEGNRAVQVEGSTWGRRLFTNLRRGDLLPAFKCHNDLPSLTRFPSLKPRHFRLIHTKTKEIQHKEQRRQCEYLQIGLLYITSAFGVIVTLDCIVCYYSWLLYTKTGFTMMTGD